LPTKDIKLAHDKYKPASIEIIFTILWHMTIELVYTLANFIMGGCSTLMTKRTLRI